MQAAAHALGSICEASTNKKVRIGSICTGTGAGDVAPELVCEYLGLLFGCENIRTEVVFMCEKDHRNVEWLKRNFPGVRHIFKNAAQMGYDSAPDWKGSGLEQKTQM